MSKTPGFKAQLKTKFLAAGIHASFSAIIFVILGYQIYNYWYPMHHFYVDGGIQGIRIVFFCDVVLGPFLTFIIFNKFKQRKELVMDLAFITTVQLIALAWGVHVVYGERPLAIVEEGGQFHGLTIKHVLAQDKTPADVRKLSNDFPIVLTVDMPGMKPEELTEVMQAEVPFFLQLKWLTPFKNFAEEAKGAQVDIHFLAKDYPPLKKRLDHWLETRGGTVDDYFYSVYLGDFELAVIVFNKDGKLIGYLGRPF